MASVSGLSPTITTDMTLKMKTTPTPVVSAVHDICVHMCTIMATAVSVML